MRRWRIEDSAELYNINGWGLKYFSINDKGHVAVTPREGNASVDLKELMDELQVRDVTSPVLVRFPDILDNRIEKISKCFEQAAEEYGYTASNAINMFYKQIILNRGLPFEVKIPTARPVDISRMNVETLDMELEKGYADMQAGRTKSAAQVFADIRRDYNV